MAYGSYYPGSYQNSYYPQIQMPVIQQPQPQQNVQGLIWVQGEGAAKSYLVAPGNTVALFDNESQTIYVKSADATGMPTMKILDYTMRTDAPQVAKIQPLSEYASKEDVDYLKNEIEALRAKFGEMEGKKK